MKRHDVAPTRTSTATLKSAKDSPSHEKHAEKPNADSWSICGLNGLRPVGGTFHFTLDFNGFNNLIEATYGHLCELDPDYSIHVSLGMFTYYCGVALWYRLYAVRYAQGCDRFWYFPDLKHAIPCKLLIPKAIAKFLDTIGDFYEPDSHFYWKLVFSDFSKTSGHFGKMSAENYFKYMAYPAPAILIATMEKELHEIKEGKRSFQQWKLNGINYEGCSANRSFTRNVCGYCVPLIQASPCDILINDPIGEMLSTGLELIKASDISSWWVCPTLITYITEINKEIEDCPMTEYANETRYGSPIQMGFVQFLHEDCEDGDPTSSVTVQGFSPFPIHDSQSSLIPVFRLRAQRADVLDAYPYDFSSRDKIPVGWAENLNATFNYGDAGKCWNLGRYTTGQVHAKLAVADYVRRF